MQQLETVYPISEAPIDATSTLLKSRSRTLFTATRLVIASTLKGLRNAAKLEISGSSHFVLPLLPGLPPSLLSLNAGFLY